MRNFLVPLTLLILVLPVVATPPGEVAKEADRRLQEELFTPADAKLAPRTSDETFLRRVSLDTIGRQPSPDDVARFGLDAEPEKRAKKIEQLLADSKYGENWARYWRDVIMYRRTEQRAQLAVQPLNDYLVKKLNENAPWNEIATSFVTALGDVKENGNAALIVAQEGKPEETVAEISRIFLGINIQCAQCHDHPTDRWKREQFHELAAFFPRVASRPQMGDQRTIIVSANDSPMGGFRGGNAMFRFRGTPEHYMSDLQNPQSRGKLMQPVFFLNGESLPRGTKDYERRETLAKWITAKDNEYFAKALVNRLWSELVGEGFYEPVDDIGPDRTPSAPYTLAYLAKEFAATDYDVKWLFTTILSTEAYQRESRPRRQSGETPFTANVPQRLRSDQLYDNLVLVLGNPPQFGRGGGGMPGGRGGFGGARFVFQQTFGYGPSVARDDIQGSIPQALAMMNGPMVNGGRATPGTWLGRMLSKTSNDDDAIGDLYLKVLAREPSQGELAACKEYLKEVDNRNLAYEDLLWTLLNSAEFLHRK